MLSQGSPSSSSSVPVREEQGDDGKPKPVNVDPVLALELRLRWLEAILVGVKPELEPVAPPPPPPSSSSTLRPGADGALRSRLGAGSNRLGSVRGRPSAVDAFKTPQKGKEREGTVTRNEAVEAAVAEMLKPGETLIRLVAELKKKLNEIVASHDGFQKFMDRCRVSNSFSL